MKSFFINKVLFWFPLIIVGFVNGAFRTFILTRFLTDFLAHQISTLLLIVMIVLYTEFVYHKLTIRTSHDAWLTGIIWMCLTAIFEFALGYFSGLSVGTMLKAYNVLEGNLWGLVVIGILIIPWLYFKVGEKKVSKAN